MIENLRGSQKAAALLVILGSDVAGEVFKHLSEEEVEKLTVEVANLPIVSSDDRDAIVSEFQQMIMAQQFTVKGGAEYAREILTRSVGVERAEELLAKLLGSGGAGAGKKRFEFMKRVDPNQLLNLLQCEHPQTIAIVLAYTPATQASLVLTQLAPEIQADVVRRLATLDRSSPEALGRVEAILESQLATGGVATAGGAKMGGVPSVVAMLQEVDRDIERAVLDGVAEQDAELAEEIRKKMFTFEDIAKLDGRSAQRVLRELDIRELALSLRGASETAANMVFKNMPKRAVTMLKEEMEFLGSVRAKDVEDAQLKVVNVIRQLEDAGEIVVARGGGAML